METVLHVRAVRTCDLNPMDLTREDNFVEFACYGEAMIACEEYHVWAKASTVEEYLAFGIGCGDGSVANNGKLGTYWENVTHNHSS